MIRQKIIKLIQKTTGQKLEEIQVERPAEKVHGDYATNIALLIAEVKKEEPMKIAQAIRNRLLKLTEAKKLFEKIEVAGPGFINFFLSKEYLQKQVEEILKKGKNFGELDIGRNKKTNIEFISANPTGPLHLGHGRGAFFGDCLANVLEKAGYKVTREYYINDAKNSAQIKELGKTAIGKGITYLNDYLKEKISNFKYRASEGSEGGKEDEVLFDYQISKLTESEAGYKLAQGIQKDIKNFIENKLKIKFDNWVSEENLYRKSKVDKIYNWLKKENLIYKKEKAEWLKTSKFGDKQDWVIIRETGEPTYLLSDLAYHQDKFNRRFQKIINIWGADHQGHVSKIRTASKMLGFKGDLDILISQVVRLKRGKISKRKGETITLEWLIDEVGLDPARFIYLMKSSDTQMEFDVELAKERSEKSPVYYVQYAHARICSIFKKAKMKEKQMMNKFTMVNLLQHPTELKLIRQIIRFPEIIEDTSKDYQVQRLPQYALDLATAFHQFYRDCQVISDDKNLTQARLFLVLVTKTVLKNTLNLMGVSAPEKM